MLSLVSDIFDHKVRWDKIIAGDVVLVDSSDSISLVSYSASKIQSVSRVVVVLAKHSYSDMKRELNASVFENIVCIDVVGSTHKLDSVLASVLDEVNSSSTVVIFDDVLALSQLEGDFFRSMHLLLTKLRNLQCGVLFFASCESKDRCLQIRQLVDTLVVLESS